MPSQKTQQTLDNILKKVRTAVVVIAALGIVIIDSASQLVSMIVDSFFTAILLLGVYWRK